MSALPIALLTFAAGATWLQWQPELPAIELWLTAAGLGTLGAVFVRVLFRRTQRRTRTVAQLPVALLVAFASVAFGFGYAAWRAEIRLADELPHGWEGVDITLTGVIDELPQSSIRGTRFAFAVERVETPSAVVPSRLSLAWFAQSRNFVEIDQVPWISAGERWRLTVRLKRPHGTVNPHGFDIEAWMLENNLRATGYVRKNESNARIDAFAGRPADYVEHCREKIRSRILAALPDKQYVGVIVALTIGDQRAIPEHQWQIFNRTGISHLISISGLHVTVFAALAGLLAYGLARRSMRLTTRIPARKAAALVGVIAATIYVLLAGSQIPAQRTLLMLAVAALGLGVARPGTASIVWLWALVVVIAWDPWAGLTPGFWLSFGSVGLLLYANVGRISATPPATLRQKTTHAFNAAARTQALVTIGLVPMTLALFQQVSLISPIANALAIPVVTFAVVPLALAGIILPIDFLWHAAHAIFEALMVPLVWMSSAPAAVWQQHAPPAWAVIAAMIGVAWIASPRGVPARWMGAAWLLPLFIVATPKLEVDTFRMTVLDVGQGLAVVIQTRHHALLYDAGPRYTDEADAGGRIIAPYLRAAAIPHLDAMIISHQDTDHSGGARTLLQTVPVDWLASSVDDDHPIVAQRTSENAITLRCEAGQHWEWEGVQFTILHPAIAQYDIPQQKANDLSCVVYVESLYGSALLTGDIEAKSEAELVRRDASALQADVLIVPHHGSKTSSTFPFIDAVAPQIAVFTAGYRNRFGHPRPDIVARYANAGIARYRTDLDGALTFEFTADSTLRPRLEREHNRRYWWEAPQRDGTALD